MKTLHFLLTNRLIFLLPVVGVCLTIVIANPQLFSTIVDGSRFKSTARELVSESDLIVMGTVIETRTEIIRRERNGRLLTTFPVTIAELAVEDYLLIGKRPSIPTISVTFLGGRVQTPFGPVSGAPLDHPTLSKGEHVLLFLEDRHDSNDGHYHILEPKAYSAPMAGKYHVITSASGEKVILAGSHNILFNAESVPLAELKGYIKSLPR